MFKLEVFTLCMILQQASNKVGIYIDSLWNIRLGLCKECLR